MTRPRLPHPPGPATTGPGPGPVTYRTPHGRLIIASLNPAELNSPLRRHLDHLTAKENPTP